MRDAADDFTPIEEEFLEAVWTRQNIPAVQDYFIKLNHENELRNIFSVERIGA